jgi:hypothetical protein
MSHSCEACGVSPPGGGYDLRKPGGTEHRCLRCAFRYRPLLKRSARTALLVGTILTLLNQGDQLLGLAPRSALLWWKIALTYAVPFAVATYGSLANAKRG